MDVAISEREWKRPVLGDLSELDSCVHIYCEPIGDPLPEPTRGLLSLEERERASSYIDPGARRRFVWVRARLRALLGQYLECDPNMLVLEYSPSGKPFLSNPGLGRLVEFNVSHSADMAVYGFTRGVAVGVDIEYCAPIPSIDCLIDRVLTEGEKGVLVSLPEELCADALISTWVCKEASLKQSGLGLRGLLHSIEVPSQIMKTGAGCFEHNAGGDKICRVEAWVPVQGYRAAVAVAGEQQSRSLKLFKPM